MTTAPPVRFCPRHRVPLGTAGCPRCSQEEKLKSRHEERAYWRWLLRASVPLLLFGVWLAVRPQKPEPDRLDPEPFRNAIETAESVLYRGDRLTYEDRTALADGLQALGEQLHKSLPSVALRLAIEDMDPFLGITAFEASEDHLDVVAARQRWEVLRAKHFQQAKWFEHGSRALEEAQTSAVAKGVPPDAEGYRASLEQIRALSGRIQDAIERLPANPDELDSDSYEIWQSVKQDTARDVARIRSQLPLKHNDVDASWQQALRKLEKALDAVSKTAGPDIHTPTLVPMRATGGARVYQANIHIQAAREAIETAAR